jgi:DNA-binding Lrp family transcriptional regulator
MKDKAIILLNNFESGNFSSDEKNVLNSLFQSANLNISFSQLSTRIAISESDIATILIKLRSLGIISIYDETISINMEKFKLI